MKRFLLFCLVVLSTLNTKAQCWKEIDARQGLSAGIKTDGSLWIWGEMISLPFNGGPVSTVLFSTPVPIQVGTATNWKTVSIGRNHIMAIQNNGTLWGMGGNSAGQLGNGNTTTMATFIQIGTVTNWVSVSAGTECTIALRANGTLWSWGDNSSGQLGDGTGISRILPAQIGTDTDWKHVSIGHITCAVAVKTNGTMWVWGSSNPMNPSLGLGPGIFTRILPTQIGTDTDWKEAYASKPVVPEYMLALKTNGTVWGWGWNAGGQLGDGTYINRNVPVQIGTANDWQSISVGNGHNLGLKTSGVLWSWGGNANGSLGNGTNSNTNVPVQMNAVSNWQIMSAGVIHCLAVRTDGSLWSWGWNVNGQLGDGSHIDKNYPVEISALNLTIASSSASVCVGSPVTLSAVGGTTYTWTNGVSNGVPFVPASSGVYTVTGADALGCYNAATVAVTVIPNTTVTAQATPVNVCAGGTITLNGSGAGSYSWSNGVTDGVAFIPTAATTYTVTDATGCSNTASITVNVIPLPIVSVNNAMVCAGSNALLTASVNPVSGTTYNWSSASTSNSLTVSPTINSSYTVTATNNGCSASAVASVSVIPVNVPVTGFSYPTPLCLTASNPLPSGVSGFSPGGIYSSGAGVTVDPVTGLLDLSTTTTGTYAVTYSVVANGCDPSNSTTVIVNITDPTAAVTGFAYPSPLCSNDADPSVLLNPNFSTGGSFSGSGLTINPANGSIDLSNSSAGTYTVTYTVNAANCVMAGTNSAIVVINSAPVLSVSPSTLIVVGDQIVLNATSSTNTYTWYPLSNLSCSDCATPTASPEETTTYCVKTTDGVCTNSVCVTVSVESLCEGDNGLYLPNAFSPNGDGNNDVFCVQGRNRCISSFQMMIYDRWGEKIFESSDPLSCWDGSYKGKLLNPDVFVYYIKAQDQNRKELIKKGNVSLIK